MYHDNYVSMISLIGNSEKYNHKKVHVEGFLTVAFEGSAFYLHEVSAKDFQDQKCDLNLQLSILDPSTSENHSKLSRLAHLPSAHLRSKSLPLPFGGTLGNDSDLQHRVCIHRH